MRIDQARIAIHERTWADNLDLALQVIRQNAKGVLAAALVGALPFVLINYAIINYWYVRQLAEDTDLFAALLAVMLVMIEVPLGTSLVTLYLGQALFVEHPDVRRIARDFASSLPQLFVFQVIVRVPLIVPVLTWIIPYGIWPYLNEVILLERNPITTRQGQVSTMTRNSMLHRGGGDYLARALGSAAISACLIIALWISQSVVLSMLLGIQEGWTVQVVALQCVLWTVAVYFTVARFLSYLDQRIRGEGWEVELFLRGRRQRLERQAA